MLEFRFFVFVNIQRLNISLGGAEFLMNYFLTVLCFRDTSERESLFVLRRLVDL